VDEDLPIDSFKSGATDFIPKKALIRLAPAVRRAMREVEERMERQRLEAQVIESQKLELISQLSSGVAHDFNNLLAVILGYSDLIMSQLGDESPLRKYTEEIRHASNRAAGLTRQLLIFSRKQLVRPSVINPNDAVKDLPRSSAASTGSETEMKYIMIIAGNTDHSSDGVAAPDALAFMQREIPKWVDEMNARGVRLFGRELDLPNTAATVRVRDGETLVTDGPFAETKEFMAGFDLLECADLDEAVEVGRNGLAARYCPFACRSHASAADSW